MFQRVFYKLNPEMKIWIQVGAGWSKMSDVEFFVGFFGGWWGYKNHAGAFSAVYLPKARPHLREIVVIGFTENVKNVGRNNAIHHFDT